MRPRYRLRFALAAVAALVLTAGAAEARLIPIRVLVAPAVTERAAIPMSLDLWTGFVTAYVNAETVRFGETRAPTLDDCTRAHADYLLAATFDLRPGDSRDGRVAGRAHFVLTNCVTGATASDRIVDVLSDAPPPSGEGDYETAPEIAWRRSVPAALAKQPLALAGIAHVIYLAGPLARVDIEGANLRAGDVVRDFAFPDRKRRVTPIVLTVTQVFPGYVEAVYDATDAAAPRVGDLVDTPPRN